MTNLVPFIILFIGGIVLTAGDIIMKKWVVTDSTVFFLSGLFVYMVGMIFLALSFKYKNIAVASTIFVIFNIVTLSIVSWLYFKETLTLTQLIGIALGVCAVVALEIG